MAAPNIKIGQLRAAIWLEVVVQKFLEVHLYAKSFYLDFILKVNLNIIFWSSHKAQRDKNLALSLQWLRLLLWLGLNPQPGNFHMLWVRPKKIN